MNNKTVILTGSNGLIGKVLSKHLRRMEYKVFELDVSDGHDLTDEKFVKKWFSENKAAHLINLFAINDSISSKRSSSSFLDIDLVEFEKCMNVNVTSLFSVCREFIRNQAKGNVINFSSIYGVGSPRSDMYDNSEKFIAYGVSKASVIQMTKHLAVHTAPNFRINCVIAGGVIDSQPENFIKLYSKNTPIKRMMEPEEIIGIVDFLLSSGASYCTGGQYTVDGGWTAW
jgi:NAD(P)-dependent dehydrogenase (short-subunit alcohol dehydrogenase family)